MPDQAGGKTLVLAHQGEVDRERECTHGYCSLGEGRDLSERAETVRSAIVNAGDEADEEAQEREHQVVHLATSASSLVIAEDAADGGGHLDTSTTSTCMAA